jgi:tRNA(fMet)-specific endonuclease VapC
VFLLDTDHLVILQQETRPEFARLAGRMADYSSPDFYVSIVSFHEQVLGWTAYLNRAKTSEGVVRAYSKFQGILVDFAALQIVPFDEAAAQAFDSFRKQRVRIGTMDLRIAASALTRGFAVLSRNLVDFQKVPGLRVEDWTAAG